LFFLLCFVCLFVSSLLLLLLLSHLPCAAAAARVKTSCP
jgi:hypothetical protein